ALSRIALSEAYRASTELLFRNAESEDPEEAVNCGQVAAMNYGARLTTCETGRIAINLCRMGMERPR
ncbi:MAG: hypothetical protein WA265_06755, partial [Rhodomicrobium sp.]